jgi:hypothetical protein
MLDLLGLRSDADDQREIAPFILQLDPGALFLWRAFEAALEPRLGRFGDLAHITDWAGKLAGAVARLAGILHVATHHDRAGWRHPISKDIFERATLIGYYLITHALAAYEMTAEMSSAQASTVWNWIVRANLITFSLREAFEAMKGRFKRVDALRIPMNALLEHHFIREVPPLPRLGAGRKPSPVYEVNPLALAYAAYNSQNSHNTMNETPHSALDALEFEEVV